jgi:hypothetical protein
MKTRQVNVLKSPAKMTRQNNPPWQLAGFRCDFIGIVFLLIFYTFYDTIFTPIYSQYVSTVRLLLSLANKDEKKKLSIKLLNLRILP